MGAGVVAGREARWPLGGHGDIWLARPSNTSANFWYTLARRRQHGAARSTMPLNVQAGR
jgi:hypothetical protein